MPGPFFFAWADSGEAFDPAIHSREDEAVISFRLTQTEGDFAGLTVDILNPGGLLAPGRKFWAWFSWHNGTETIPVFFGRMVGIPEQIEGETIQLLLTAKPLDYDGVKATLAAELRVLPYWDTVWLMGDLTDDDAVLNTYGAVWHIDRTTLQLTISDEAVGEDGTLSVGEADHIYSDLTISYTNPPLSQVWISGTLTWTQSGSGTIDVTDDIYNGFAAVQTPYAWVDARVITTLTGNGLATSWPKAGTSFGGGWTVNKDTGVFEAPDYYERFGFGVNFNGTSTETDTVIPPGGVTANDFWYGYQDYNITYDVSAFSQVTKFDWLADKKRTEIFLCKLTADIQPLLAEPDAAENISKLTLTAADTVTEPAEDGTMPIADVRRKSYLNTDRGSSSVQHLLLLARAQLRRRARAVEVRFKVPWALGLTATLRKNAQIVDYRLPGGEAFGKITGYELSGAGMGEFFGEITIGCSIGRGGTVSAAAGTPTYVELGYVADGYQQQTGAEVTIPTDDIVYQTLDDVVVDDDGVNLLDFQTKDAVQTLSLENSVSEQMQQVVDVTEHLPKAAPTTISIQMRPVSGLTFSTTYEPVVQLIPLPKTIDLGAAA